MSEGAAVGRLKPAAVAPNGDTYFFAKKYVSPFTADNAFAVAGHGETMPASNADPSGRRLNRRVAVTLVGRQARGFSA